MLALLTRATTAAAAVAVSPLSSNAGPPRGWNSYDAFTWTVNETQFLENCAAAASLLGGHGFEYCVVDFLWFQCDWRYNPGCDVDDPSWLVDQFGRPQPDPLRWPSAAAGAGFRPVSDKVHEMGMKFGIHIMVGTSTAALNKTVKGTSYLVSEVTGNDDCPWPSHGHNPHCTCNWQAKSLDINVSHPGGRAYYDSLYEQYLDLWNVDFIKNDCVFGVDFRPAQVKYQSSLIRGADHPVLYSLSPGGSEYIHLSRRHRAHAARVYYTCQVFGQITDYGCAWRLLSPEMGATVRFDITGQRARAPRGFVPDGE